MRNLLIYLAFLSVLMSCSDKKHPSEVDGKDTTSTYRITESIYKRVYELTQADSIQVQTTKIDSFKDIYIGIYLRNDLLINQNEDSLLAYVSRSLLNLFPDHQFKCKLYTFVKKQVNEKGDLYIEQKDIYTKTEYVIEPE